VLTASLQRLCREALVWRQLKHPYILPFMGVDIDTFQSSDLVCLVTPWMDLGTLRAFTNSDQFHPETDTYRIVSEETA
jgi:serine/threonine protein kinase